MLLLEMKVIGAGLRIKNKIYPDKFIKTCPGTSIMALVYFYLIKSAYTPGIFIFLQTFY